MRPIDANELKEWVENWLYKDRYYHNGKVSKTIPITELYDILEQILTTDVPDTNIGDIISRWDAIDALACFTEKSPTGRTAQEVVKALPSAQPDVPDPELAAILSRGVKGWLN